ncbi:MAG: hypothetical protein FWG17_06225 [Desulfovibrionaceae bacterium]|nr:hypothetical protein [Desulfovibrionaceae bacterium]
MYLADRLLRLEEYVKGHCPALDAPLPAHTLIFSISDGEARAEVLHVSGSSLEQCWKDGLRRLRRRMQLRKLHGEHLRLDWVRKVRSCAFDEFLKLAEQTKRGYLRYGLALDQTFTILLTEQEANSRAIYYHESNHDSSRFNPDRFTDWATKRFSGQEVRLPAPEATVWALDTAGVYCAPDGTLYHLPGLGPGKTLNSGFFTGRREINRFTPELGDDTITGAARWLAAQIRKDGRFIYGWLPCFDKNLTSYNCLRHASSLYSLLEALEYTGDEALKEPARRALERMVTEFVREYAPQGKKMAFLVDLPVSEIKLGGNGVTLLALAKWRDLTGTDEHLPLMELLAQGINFMRDESNGVFTHVLHAESLALKEQRRVIYYDGEAVFGLLRLYRHTKDPRWLDLAQKSFDSFLDDARYAQAHDHWLSYATNEITLYYPQERYFRFGLNNCMGHLDFVLQRETSYPTLLELMMATQKMLIRLADLPELQALTRSLDLEKFRTALHYRANYLLEGFFWPEMSMYFPRQKRTGNTFFLRHHGFRERIDDVQHFISGFIAYTSMLKEDQPEWRPPEDPPWRREP